MFRRLVATCAIATTIAAFLGCGGKDSREQAPAQSESAAESAAAATSTPAPSPASSATEEEAFAAPGEALVGLDGSYRAPPPIPDGRPRIFARAMLVPVHDKPDPSSRKIGFLRAGAAALADDGEAGRGGCPKGWRAVKPAGFVCQNEKVTSDEKDPIVAAMRAPDRSQKLPYMYGTVTRGGPVYSKIPSAADLDRHEPSLAKHITKWKNDEVSGASYGLELWYKWKTPPAFTAWQAWEDKVTDSDIPPYLRDGGQLPNLSGLIKEGAVKIDQVDRRQGAAFIDSFLHEGRRYNVTTDLRLVPADRYRPIRGSDLAGVRIGVDVEFPFALVRRKGGKQYTWSASKKKMVAAGELEYRAAIQLTGKQKIVANKLHYETKDGTWVDDRHASRLDPAKRMPKWGKNGEKWLDVNITKQTLVAFEGEKAVYATIVSTGEDGLLEGARTTEKGIFRIHTKYVTATMDSDAVGEEFELRDVPYVQYFKDGFALHGAYWHDAFGMPKSHGCINLAPEDARRIFHWTEPSVPPNWHGAAKSLTGTVLFVHP